MTMVFVICCTLIFCANLVDFDKETTTKKALISFFFDDIFYICLKN